MPPSSCTTSASPPSTTLHPRSQQVSRPVILSSNIAPRQMNSHVGQTFFKSPTLVGILAISHAFFFLNSYRVMAPVVHQVPLQVGLQDHQLRKAIQSGQRDLNHSLHRGLPGRVAHLPVLIPILDRGLPCIQVSHITFCFTLSGSSDALN